MYVKYFPCKYFQVISIRKQYLACLNDYAISSKILNLLKYSFLQDDRHHFVRENTLSLKLLLAWHSLIMNETRSEDQIYLKSINLKINLVVDT